MSNSSPSFGRDATSVSINGSLGRSTSSEDTLRGNGFPAIPADLAERGLVHNNERAEAYAKTPEHKLAQYAVTGCLNGTFYASGKEQLQRTLDLARDADPEFVAKLAVYARKEAGMKEMPALLLAVLAERGDLNEFRAAFPHVIDGAKMLRNFVKFVRPGHKHDDLAEGITRRSLGTVPKKLIQQWFANQTDDGLFRQSYGNNPSIADVIKLSHTRAGSESRQELHNYLLDKPFDESKLPTVVQQLLEFRRDPNGAAPRVPFEFLKTLPLRPEQWGEIAMTTSYQTLRQNLRLFEKRGAFENEAVVDAVAARIADPAEIARAGVVSFQLFVAYKESGPFLPKPIRRALEKAVNTSLDHVPELEGRVVLCPDLSTSMRDPVTGQRFGATATTQCVDVAALMSSALLRKNPDALILPFNTDLLPVAVSPESSVMSNAQLLSRAAGGGTDCSAPIRELNRRREKVDFVIFVSDYESWSKQGLVGTALGDEWEKLSTRCPNARLACIDITPYETLQAKSGRDVLNVGGFSDSVFKVLADFAARRLEGDQWLKKIWDTRL